VDIDHRRYVAPVGEPTLSVCCTPLAGSSLSDAEAVELEQLFKTLADRHRLKIINILLRSGGAAVCVCEFQPELGVSQPTVSHHLKQLVEAGLLDREKRGSFAYFRLTPGALERISDLLAEQQVPDAV
jgi:ArsR family transcriptional regulator